MKIRNNDEEIRFKVSKGEKEKIVEQASKVNMNISSYVRYLALNSTIKIKEVKIK